MYRITLDTNELFNIRDGTGDIEGLVRLMQLHRTGKARLCVPAISASENQLGGVTLQNYSSFQQLVAEVGLDDAEELTPLWILDVTFLEHCLLASEEMIDQDLKIHLILFPEIDSDYQKFAQAQGLTPHDQLDKKWRNAKCDVQAMWSHIYHKADMFVTEDKNFHKQTKKRKLMALGAGGIYTPSECVRQLSKRD